MQWHGAFGLRKIAKKCRFFSQILIVELEQLGYKLKTKNESRFDTVAIDAVASGFSSADYLQAEFHKHDINIRKVDGAIVSISFDETSTLYDLDMLISIFRAMKKRSYSVEISDEFSYYEKFTYETLPESLKRKTKFL